MEFNIPHSVFTGDADTVAKKSFSRSVAMRAARFALPYKWLLVGFLAAILIGALLSVVPPLLFKDIIDGAIASGDRGQVNFLALLIVGSVIGEAIMSFFERWWSSRIGEGLIFDLRVQLYDHVQRLPISFFTRVQTGSLISRMNNDVIGAQRALTGTLGQVISNAVVFIITLVTMLALNWRLTILALILFPIFILPSKRVGRTLSGFARTQMNHNAVMNTQMTERLGVAGALVVKLFGNHKRERQDFSDKASKVRDTGIKMALYGRTFAITLSLVGALGTAGIYWIGGHMVIGGSITVGTLAAMGVLVARIYLPISSLANARVDIMTALVSFERVFEILDIPNAIPDKESAKELTNAQGKIELKNVSFAYKDEQSLATLELIAEQPNNVEDSNGTQAPNHQTHQAGDQLILENINIEIEPGQSIALVGHSGAGKSTLVSLISRLYDVTSGAVLIDGTDIRDLTSESLRSAIGVVHQDPHVFHDTIQSNLLYARPTATQEEMIAAARAAQIHDMIASLPDGYETIVGEQGYRFSGGEKQRLSVARMILKDPRIVILDEATNQLDSENEAALQIALNHTLQNRTAIIIAHRLSTITSVDQIYVLANRNVAESGTHPELIAQNGIYADLYKKLSKEKLTSKHEL